MTCPTDSLEVGVTMTSYPPFVRRSKHSGSASLMLPRTLVLATGAQQPLPKLKPHTQHNKSKRPLGQDRVEGLSNIREVFDADLEARPCQDMRFTLVLT